MSAAYVPLVQQRNGAEPFTLFFVGPDDTPINLTGVTLTLQVRRAAGLGGSAITTATNTGDVTITGIVITDATGGQVMITILGTDFSAFDGVMEDVELAYDLRATKSGVPPTIIMRGPFLLQPGVTV